MTKRPRAHSWRACAISVVVSYSHFCCRKSSLTHVRGINCCMLAMAQNSFPHPFGLKWISLASCLRAHVRSSPAVWTAWAPAHTGHTGTGVICPPRKEPLNGTLWGGQQERGHWIVFAFLQSNPQELTSCVKICQNHAMIRVKTLMSPVLFWHWRPRNHSAQTELHPAPYACNWPQPLLFWTSCSQQHVTARHGSERTRLIKPQENKSSVLRICGTPHSENYVQRWSKMLQLLQCCRRSMQRSLHRELHPPFCWTVRTRTTSSSRSASQQVVQKQLKKNMMNMYNIHNYIIIYSNSI